MSNSYYLIELPAGDKARLNSLAALSDTKGKPRDLIHYKYSKDGTKAIAQGNINQRIINHLNGKSYITYLGECLPSGQAEQKVYDYIDNHPEDWGRNEEK